MNNFYCYDGIERFDSLYEMLESLDAIDQLSEGVVYYTTEVQSVKASEYFKDCDIDDLIKIVEDRSKIHKGIEIGVDFKPEFSRKTLASAIRKLFDEQMNCSIVKDKNKIYKSITKTMIDEYRVKSML